MTKNNFGRRILAALLAAATASTMLVTAVFAEDPATPGADVPGVTEPETPGVGGDEGDAGENEGDVTEEEETPVISEDGQKFVDAVKDLDADAIKQAAQELADARNASRADEMEALEEAFLTASQKVEDAKALYDAVPGADKEIAAVKDAQKALEKLSAELTQILANEGTVLAAAQDEIIVGGDNATNGYSTANAATLVSAFISIADSGTVKLGANITETSGERLVVDLDSVKSITFDLNGYTLDIDCDDNMPFYMCNVHLTVKNTGANGDAAIKVSTDGEDDEGNTLDAFHMAWSNPGDCSLTLESGNIEATSDESEGISINGPVTVNSGKLTGTSHLVTNIMETGGLYAGGDFTVNDGIVTASGPVGIQVEGGDVLINDGAVSAIGTGVGMGVISDEITYSVQNSNPVGGRLTFRGGTTTIKATGAVVDSIASREADLPPFAAMCDDIVVDTGMLAKYKADGSETYDTNAVVFSIPDAGFDIFSKKIPANEQELMTSILSDVQVAADGGSTPPPVGGGGGGGGGGGTPAPAAPTNKTINSPVGNKGSEKSIANAVNSAIAAGLNNASTAIGFNNYNLLEKAGLKAINDAAAKATDGKNVNLNLDVNFDTVAGNRVVSRIVVDPAKLATVMPDKLPLGVHFDQKAALSKSTNTRFDKYFQNKIVSINYEQKSPLAVTATFKAKLDLDKTFGEGKALYFYSYDRVANVYNLIENPNYYVDANGYACIDAPLGGSIIISDSPLTRK